MSDGDDSVPREHRQRVLKGAAIIMSLTRSEIACTVRNQHEHGALLRVPADIPLPDQFTLYVASDGIAYECVVRWRRGDSIGVQFVGTGPKPKYHY